MRIVAIRLDSLTSGAMTDPELKMWYLIAMDKAAVVSVRASRSEVILEQCDRQRSLRLSSFLERKWRDGLLKAHLIRTNGEALDLVTRMTTTGHSPSTNFQA